MSKPFNADTLARLWARDYRADVLAPVRDILLNTDCDANHQPTPEGFARIAGALNALAEAARVATQVEFTEERPGVWRTATAEDAERLDDAIDAALGSLGTSLADLREAEQDETPTVCANAECGRTRPRWTMASRIVDGAEVFECSPKFAMHCAECCAPGESMTHYTAEDHWHQDHPERAEIEAELRRAVKNGDRHTVEALVKLLGEAPEGD